MNLKDFLIDNYVYIVIVIILVIVTIIGFLADKKKNGNSKGKNNKQAAPADTSNLSAEAAAYQSVNEQLSANNTLNYMPEQGPSNNENMIQNNDNLVMSNPANVGSIPTPMQGNGIASNMNMAGPQQVAFNGGNAPMPVEPINNAVANPEPMYQPLDEQKPTFNNNEVSVIPGQQPPLPVNPVIPPMGELNNGLGQGIAPTDNVGVAMPTQSVPPVNVSAPIPAAPIPAAPVPPASIPSGMAPNPAPSTIPQPMPNPNGNVNPEVVPAPAPVVPNPVSFVYGGQQTTNNQNM